MTLTHLPYNLPGKAYRSPMPFSDFDPFQRVYAAYHKNGISTVVLFPNDAECLKRSGRNLRRFYIKEGLAVIPLPTPDFQTPQIEPLRQAVEEAYELLQGGYNLAIHCYAGVGRTGTFAACLARQVFGCSGQAALDWTRILIPGAVEVPEQIETVFNFM